MARVLLLSMEVLGSSMAGPAIRYWEFAKALSKSHTVTLMAPNDAELTSPDFSIKAHHYKLPRKELKNTDVIITQSISYKLALAAKWYGVKIILDAYDPEPLEHLEIFRSKPIDRREWDIRNITVSTGYALSMADSVICANEQQKDLWTGILMEKGRITPQLYDHDPNLKQLIDTVPFGLSSTPPKKNGQSLKDRFKLRPTDHVVLWGGGIWNWFDPITLIKAIHLLSVKRNDIHLVFMGVKHPNPLIPQMKMANNAIALAQSLDLLDKHVFVNYGWLPYDERQNFLLDAHIGSSTHFDNLETRYAFRTRILDYIWAGLPILTTEGDSFAELVKLRQLGLTVPYKDEKALANAIEEIVDNPSLVKKFKDNLAIVKHEFYWENTTLPILTMIEGFKTQVKARLKFKDLRRTAAFVLRKVWLKLKKYFLSNA